jgi:hypothetical protein
LEIISAFLRREFGAFYILEAMHEVALYYFANTFRRWMLLAGIALIVQPSFGQRIDGFYRGSFFDKRVLIEIKKSDNLIVGTVMEKPRDKWYFSATLTGSSFAGASTIGLPVIAYVRALLRNDTLWVTVETPGSVKTGAFVKFDRKSEGTLLHPKGNDTAKQRDPNLLGKWIYVGELRRMFRIKLDHTRFITGMVRLESIGSS